MGVLPLEFLAGENAASLGLTGEESFTTIGLSDDIGIGEQIEIEATRTDGTSHRFAVKVRIDTPIEITYYRNGGILHTVLREMARAD
jgi:aconitate hydratase